MSGRKTSLNTQDLQYLVELLSRLDYFIDDPRGFLTLIGLPRQYVNGLNLPATNPRALAQAAITKLAYDYGRLPQPPFDYALFALIKYLLDQGWSQDDEIRLQGMVLRYKLLGVPLIGPEDEALLSQPERWYNVSFLYKGSQAIQAVCRVDRAGNHPVGTGFLVGPNLLLTNYHVLNTGVGNTENEKATSLQFRFGYLEENGLIKPGDAFNASFESEAVVAWSPIEKLDFALIRLAQPVGLEFGFLKPELRPLLSDEEISIMQHPKGWDMKFSLGLVTACKEQRVYYKAITLKGSSGSPVFDQNWALLALHRGTDEMCNANEGVPVTAFWSEIRSFLPER
jgi:hypothetical protein